jgi:hypothetical protein
LYACHFNSEIQFMTLKLEHKKEKKEKLSLLSPRKNIIKWTLYAFMFSVTELWYRKSKRVKKKESYFKTLLEIQTSNVKYYYTLDKEELWTQNYHLLLNDHVCCLLIFQNTQWNYNNACASRKSFPVSEKKIFIIS